MFVFVCVCVDRYRGDKTVRKKKSYRQKDSQTHTGRDRDFNSDWR